MTKSDKYRTRMSQMKDKNSPHTKEHWNKWVEKIQGLSDWQLDESQGRGREDHIIACLS